MPSLHEFLRQDPESVPAWLDQYHPGDAFDRSRLFSSRVIYYPGSGRDGRPVKIFGSTRAAHCFVYADYSVSSAELQAELAHPTRRFLGYHTFGRIQLAQRDLAPRSWRPHIEPDDVPPNAYSFARVDPFGFLEILERDKDRDDTHGARRLAVLFLGADGFATYDALFCQADTTPAPFAGVIVDHGSGGNYSGFGHGGLLERLATRCRVLPQWLLAAENNAWEGYNRVRVDGEGGLFLHHRT